MQRIIAGFLGIVIACFAVAVSANDHQSFDRLLSAHVRDGVVDYGAIQEDARFRQYLDYLETANPDSLATREEKLAFWINAYNALAIKGVLDGLSTAGFFSRINFFTTDYRLAGRQIDLYDLEHDVIIPFGEPRIHFAIVCASASCPKLISEAYTAATLDQQLERNARDFVNDESKNRFDKSSKSARISMIFDWYADDFEAHSTTVQRYLAQYVDDPEIAEALNKDEYGLWYFDYDWSLNGSEPRVETSTAVEDNADRR